MASIKKLKRDMTDMLTMDKLKIKESVYSMFSGMLTLPYGSEILKK